MRARAMTEEMAMDGEMQVAEFRVMLESLVKRANKVLHPRTSVRET